MVIICAGDKAGFAARVGALSWCGLRHPSVVTLARGPASAKLSAGCCLGAFMCTASGLCSRRLRLCGGLGRSSASLFCVVFSLTLLVQRARKDGIRIRKAIQAAMASGFPVVDACVSRLYWWFVIVVVGHCYVPNCGSRRRTCFACACACSL